MVTAQRAPSAFPATLFPKIVIKVISAHFPKICRGVPRGSTEPLWAWLLPESVLSALLVGHVLIFVFPTHITKSTLVLWGTTVPVAAWTLLAALVALTCLLMAVLLPAHALFATNTSIALKDLKCS